MEHNIRDLLDDYTEEEIPLRSRRSPRPETVQKRVEARLFPGEASAPRRPARSLLRTLRALPAAALLLSLLTVTAYAGLSSLLSERVYTPEGAREELILNLGAPESPEFQAALDWEQRREALDLAGENDIGLDQPEPGSQEALYAQNGAFTQAAREALDGILEQYGLTMAALLSPFQEPEELYALTGRDGFLPPAGQPGQDPWTGPDPNIPGAEHQILLPSGALYEGGSLTYSGYALLSGGGTVPYDLTLIANGRFLAGAGIITRGDGFEEWSLTAQDGTALTLDLGSGQAFVEARLANGAVFLFVRAGAEPPDEDTDIGRVAAYSGFPPLTREMLEELAVSFDYAALNALCIG